MLDKSYTEQFFNRETGKERYGLIQKEAGRISGTLSPGEAWDFAMECCGSGLYYIQMLGVAVLGHLAARETRALDFLRDRVSGNPAWQVQEFLAMAFDRYYQDSAYEKASKEMAKWLASENANNRRAVIEGLRIWTARPHFRENPREAVAVIARYKNDASEYVRKSVGNALKDISKTCPDLVREELVRWDLKNKEIRQVYKLASRFL